MSATRISVKVPPRLIALPAGAAGAAVGAAATGAAVGAAAAGAWVGAWATGAIGLAVGTGAAGAAVGAAGGAIGAQAAASPSPATPAVARRNVRLLSFVAVVMKTSRGMGDGWPTLIVKGLLTPAIGSASPHHSASPRGASPARVSATA